MTYGTITKTVSTPKKTTIASLKKQIEESKEFMEWHKKAKGEIECKVIPSVTAKKKESYRHTRAFSIPLKTPQPAEKQSVLFPRTTVKYMYRVSEKALRHRL